MLDINSAGKNKNKIPYAFDPMHKSDLSLSLHNGFSAVKAAYLREQKNTKTNMLIKLPTQLKKCKTSINSLNTLPCAINSLTTKNLPCIIRGMFTQINAKGNYNEVCEAHILSLICGGLS